MATLLLGEEEVRGNSPPSGFDGFFSFFIWISTSYCTPKKKLMVNTTTLNIVYEPLNYLNTRETEGKLNYEQINRFFSLKNRNCTCLIKRTNMFVHFNLDWSWVQTRLKYLYQEMPRFFSEERLLDLIMRKK